MATDGAAALRAAKALLPDVIVVDISLPDMTGFEVAASLLEAGSTAAIVFLSVHSEEDLVATARAAGITSYVVKPRLVLDLVQAVAEAHADAGSCRPSADSQPWSCRTVPTPSRDFANCLLRRIGAIVVLGTLPAHPWHPRRRDGRHRLFRRITPHDRRKRPPGAPWDSGGTSGRPEVTLRDGTPAL